MRINEVKKNEVNVTLSSDELVIIGNLIHFFETHMDAEPDAEKPGPAFHALAAQVITARDLCQYGHLDEFTLSCVLRHKAAASPKGRLAKKLREYIDEYFAEPGIEEQPSGTAG